MAEDITLVEAIRSGLRDEMDADGSVMVIGEDVGRSGGVFRATDGLYEEFGGDRVVDTPLTETGIAGVAVGLAASGLRPVAEIQFMGFVYSALEQLFTRAARINARSRGRYNCQLVLRLPFGGGIRAPDMHGESMEALFVHHPGFKVVAPSRPDDAYGLLRNAIRDPDPVVYLEPKRLYRSVTGSVPNNRHTVPIGKARVLREGGDVSVFTWGAMTKPTTLAAAELEPEIDAEVIDLRSLTPLDRDAIVRSFEKTGRATVVHEAPRTGGLAGEITAILQEEALLYQEAPVKRVTGYDITYPLYDLEDYQIPSPQRIKDGISETIAF